MIKTETLMTLVEAVEIYRFGKLSKQSDDYYKLTLMEREELEERKRKEAYERLIDAILDVEKWHFATEILPSENKQVMIACENVHGDKFLYAGTPKYDENDNVCGFNIYDCYEDIYAYDIRRLKVRWRYIEE